MVSLTRTTKISIFVILIIKFELYNSSETPKIIRDFKVKFFENSKCIMTFIPNKIEYINYLQGSLPSKDSALHLNIPPKTIVSAHHSIIIHSDLHNNTDIDNVTNIKLYYLDDKDKQGWLDLQLEKSPPAFKSPYYP